MKHTTFQSIDSVRLIPSPGKAARAGGRGLPPNGDKTRRRCRKPS
jgi:hypothetical protein